MSEFIIPSLCFSILFIFYLAESVSVRRIQKRIKKTICVTGTRGKSSVTRLITDMLQYSGEKTLGKVTGSKPVLIHSDKVQETIRRKRNPSILEQIRVVLKAAYREEISFLVSEIMSITPEYQLCETRKILNPEILIITNIREDHLGTTGNDCKEIAKVFLKSAPRKCKVIILESEWNNLFDSAPPKNVILVSNNEISKLKYSFNYEEFPENLALAMKAIELCGIEIDLNEYSKHEILEDSGVMSVFQFADDLYTVNAFAANDPESTLKVLEKTMKKFTGKSLKKTGLLVLRKDKPERTIQWCDFLNKNEGLFDQLFIVGGHSLAAQKKLKRLFPTIISEREIEIIHTKYFSEKDNIVFGFGNFVGKGEEFKNYWERTGNRL